MKPRRVEPIARGAVLAVILLAGLGRSAGSDAGQAKPPEATKPAAQTNGLGPRLRFAAPAYDFGRVLAGGVVKHDFVFTNAGDGLLRVQDVRATCGCASAANWSREVGPGKCGVIPLEFHTRNFNGPVTKQVTVTCNDSNQPAVSLEIKGTVWRPILVSPEAAAFTGPLEALTNAYRVLRILNQQQAPLSLGEPESSHRAFAAEVRTNRPGQEYELTIRLVPPVGAGNTFGNVTLKTSSPEWPVLTIPVWALVQSAVMALPAQFVLRPGPLTNRLTQAISIRSVWDKPLVLSEPSVNAKGVEVLVKEMTPGRLFTVALSFPPGFAIGPKEQVELSLRSNHPQFPLIKVPVLQPP